MLHGRYLVNVHEKDITLKELLSEVQPQNVSRLLQNPTLTFLAITIVRKVTLKIPIYKSELYLKYTIVLHGWDE
jgi:hypothetical protein